MKIALIRFFPVETKFRFIRLRFAAFAISLALMIGSIAAFFAIGLNFGIDFRGGTLIEVQTEGPASDRAEEVARREKAWSPWNGRV